MCRRLSRDTADRLAQDQVRDSFTVAVAALGQQGRIACSIGTADVPGPGPEGRRMLRKVTKVLGLLALAAALLLAALQIANSGSNPGVPPTPPGAIRIATHNVHYIDLTDPGGRWSRAGWERRRDALDAAFKAMEADVVAFQEMETFAGGSGSAENLALDFLLDRNPDFAAAATGDWREFPSTQAILYRTARLSLLDQGWFFFSETPEVIYSRTFDGSWPAFASWAEFRPRDGGAPFRVVNVHFEYRSASNRLLSAALVRDRIAPVIAEGGTVFVVGDLNARRGSPTARRIAEAGIDFAPVDGSTYHFDRGLNLFFAIDHLGASPGVERVGGPVVLRQRFGGRWPSDHYPVFADYLLPGAGRAAFSTRSGQ
jgi:endonuclease/exonuclease/phosphatase family metal-dependent hydrolase